MTEPLNETDPISTVKTDASSAPTPLSSPAERNSTSATMAAAPPPTPLNSATSCGIAVICTWRAAGTPNAVPSTIATRIGKMWSKSSATRVTPTAITAPTAPSRLPRRAYFGDDSPFSARMKHSAATR